MWSGKKIGNKEFDIRLKKEYPYFNRISNYVNSKTVIILSCTRCKKTFKKKPKELNNLRCLCIEREIRYKHLLIDKEVELVDNYINIREKLLHKCKKCDLLFKSSPKSI